MPWRLFIHFFSVFLFCFSSAQAQTNFVVEAIQVEGLERINQSTVLNYVPIRPGEEFTQVKSARIIRDLYDTGFFQYVALQRAGNVLIIQVMESPTIGAFEIKGNKDIGKEQLGKVLKRMGLVEGHVFQRSKLEQLTKDLRREYENRGKYNAKIDATVSPMDRNRVAIEVDVSEGRASKIKAVKIIGNEAFSEKELLKQLSISTPGLFTFFTGTDKFSQEKLAASLEALTSYYLDRGYIRFKVLSSQVLLSPNKKDVYIDIKIEEGPQYTFSGYDIAGNPIISRELIDRIVNVKPGEVYSRQKVVFASTVIGDALGNEGYGFPTVEPRPTISDVERTVFITFFVDPGRHVYVRRINFRGNTKTADYVLRTAMRQNEGALVSLASIRESERQLRILGYLENVRVETVPVPNTNNQVDLHFNVEEMPSAEAMAALGYGTDGFEVSAALNQYNLLGTGKTLGVNFNASRWGETYSANFYDPYYKPNGIGRGFSFFYQRLTPSDLNISGYTSDRLGGEVNYSFLVSDRSSLVFAAGYEHLDLTLRGKAVPQQLFNFVKENGSVFNQVRLRGAWTYNSYDRYPFPTDGFNQQVSSMVALPADSRSLYYYTVRYLARYYQPLFADLILSVRGNFAYGNQFNGRGLPFYENFFSGGIAEPGMIRGYDSYSIGPRDDNGDYLGGNMLVSGSVGLILPRPFSTGPLRTTAFVDGGNVYSFGLPANQQGSDPGPMRFSAGVSVEWRSPFGPLEFSLAGPINPQPGDRVQNFQFTVSSGF